MYDTGGCRGGGRGLTSEDIFISIRNRQQYVNWKRVFGDGLGTQMVFLVLYIKLYRAGSLVGFTTTGFYAQPGDSDI
jgi:hypothetical protein